jgi:hypothetical protein
LADAFAPGTRVRRRDFHVFRDGVIPAGVTGVVVAATADLYAVRLDERRPALDAWVNEIRLWPADAGDDGLEALAWLLFETITPA